MRISAQASMMLQPSCQGTLLNSPYNCRDWACLLGSDCSMQSVETFPRARLQVCYSAPTLSSLHFTHRENRENPFFKSTGNWYRLIS